MIQEAERFKYWQSNYIVVYPTNNMAKKELQINESLDETSLAILKSFFPEGIEKTLNELQERAKYSHEPMHRTLSSLVKRKILTARKIGKTVLYKLDMKNWFAKLAFYHYTIERVRKFSEKYPTLVFAMEKLPRDKIETLIIFGSYAKGNETENSDVDILAVSSEKKAVDLEIRALTHSFKMREFHAIVLPRTEFIKIKAENKEFWRDLVQYGIIFKGSDLVYENAYVP